ncbi:MAG: ABC transporter ATP-binding protein, partial [Alphaproteobacteria bacterium]|nr:ABC transporter ATP-binding protein [Alphaproteobacteria bacterium]
MIEIEGLSKRFGDLLAVDNVSFAVDRGEVLGFLGPNGAGKTTTMRMITGYLTPDSGRVGVCGHDVTGDDIAAKAAIGYLPEGAPLYGDMTPRALLDFVASVRRMSASKARERTDWAVSRLGIESVFDQPMDTLSKGYKRRVGLAQALLHDPEVLILDEPTDGLDPNQKHEVRSLIGEMAQDKAIIISTHILEEVDAVCSRAVIISRGKLVADGTPVELAARSRYHNAVTLTLRGVAPPEAQSSLAAIAGVAEVALGDAETGVTRCTLFPEASAAIIAEVSR